VEIKEVNEVPLNESYPSGIIVMLFEKYERYFRALNFKDQARLYGKHVIAAGPGGVAYHRNNLFNRFVFNLGMRSFYKKAGMTSVRIMNLEELHISRQYSMVKVHWGAKFQTTGRRLIEFDISYLVRKTAFQPEIILFISHEDEQELFKKYGLMM
jgi:hypothetical protein